MGKIFESGLFLGLDMIIYKTGLKSYVFRGLISLIAHKFTAYNIM